MTTAFRFGQAVAEAYFARTTHMPPITTFTVQGWVKVNADPGHDGVIFMCGATGAGANYQLYWRQSTGNQYGLWNGSSSAFGSASAVIGRWNNVAITVNGSSGSNFLLYVNGVLDVTHTAASISSGAIRIGSDDAHDWTDVTVDDLFIYDVVLTQAEIIANMYSHFPTVLRGLNSCWPNPGGWDRFNNIYLPKASSSRWAELTGSYDEWTETGTIVMEEGAPI